MAETSTEPRSETPPITMCDKPLHENHEPRLGDMSDVPAAASLDVETKTKSDSYSHEVPDNGSAIKFHDSSPNSSDSSSPNSSSPNSVHTTFPDSNVLKTSHLPEDSSKENQNTQPSTLCDTSSRSDSDGETVILGNPTAMNENYSDKASPNNSSAEDSGAVSGAGIQINPDVERSGTPDSFRHDGSDSSSQGSTTTSPVSPALSHPLVQLVRHSKSPSTPMKTMKMNQGSPKALNQFVHMLLLFKMAVALGPAVIGMMTLAGGMLNRMDLSTKPDGPEGHTFSLCPLTQTD